jgi:hypothetical protein
MGSVCDTLEVDIAGDDLSMENFLRVFHWLPESEGGYLAMNCAAWRIVCLILATEFVQPVFADSVPERWTVSLPQVSEARLTGKELAKRWDSLSLADRERMAQSQILAGNVPDAWRHFVPIRIAETVEGRIQELVIFVASDYLCVGPDNDSFRMPMSPVGAQRIADSLDCLLPTKRLVDEIYKTASVKLDPQPLPPIAEMTRVSYFAKHHEIIERQLKENHRPELPGQLIAGHKKDVVLTARLENTQSRVAIYGWHRTFDQPIQPLYVGHVDSWVDYSHGIRLVARKAFLNGTPCDLRELLTHERLHVLVSDEGAVIAASCYTTPGLEPKTAGEKENVTVMQWSPDVRVFIDEVAGGSEAKSLPTEMVFYALPNGNTIEQSLGKPVVAGDDWHFDIQHVAAQTRFLRHEQPEKNIVLILLEAKGLSWPSWRKTNRDELIVRLINDMRGRYSAYNPSIVLSGHSGGGSLIFGYLNASPEIPTEVARIAFLDATYAYDTERHRMKIADWLKKPGTSLCVLAYKDDEVTLNGKRIVSATGGTWYRSRLMRDDLATSFEFTEVAENEIVRVSNADRRIQFLLHTNPANKILHTVQVEKNGLIHSLFSGTPMEEKSYRYFGERAYSELIR